MQEWESIADLPAVPSVLLQIVNAKKSLANNLLEEAIESAKSGGLVSLEEITGVLAIVKTLSQDKSSKASR